MLYDGGVIKSAVWGGVEAVWVAGMNRRSDIRI